MSLYNALSDGTVTLLVSCYSSIKTWLMSFEAFQAQFLGKARKVAECAVAGLTCLVSSYMR